MFPDIVSINPAASSSDAAKTYSSDTAKTQTQGAENPLGRTKSRSQTERLERTEAPPAERAGKETGVVSRYAANGEDKVEIRLTLSPEEKDAFVKAFSASEELSEEDRASLQDAAKRITAAIDEVVEKNRQKVNAVNKAVAEWYYTLTQDDVGGIDLLGVFHDMAMGKFDEFTIAKRKSPF